MAPKTTIGRFIKRVRIELCLWRIRILGNGSMQITTQQEGAIRQWAEKTRLVSEVRLFGSRAMGCAWRRSDVDLAVKLTGTDPIQVFANYLSERQRWEPELSNKLGLKAHTSLYNPLEGDDAVKRHCDACSFVLFKREKTT